MAKVRYLCAECGVLAGKQKPTVRQAFTRGKCDICSRKTEVLHFRAWGVFVQQDFADAKRAIRELGLHADQAVCAPDVLKLIAVVEQILPEEKRSKQLKHIIKDIRLRIEFDRPIYRFDTDQITRWMAADIALTQKADEALAAEQERQHPSPELIMVQGGSETKIKVPRKKKAVMV